jgi:alkanesulfonate monooxygenase SsuD/methylene tetrahydromethanopterin reductase-like flavin-dependent oxidoreductase (luciferase family)
VTASGSGPRFGLRFDLRRAPFSPLSDAALHRECIEMARWSDARGCGSISVSEHHGVDFVSAPVALAGMLLGATRVARVEVTALLLPLHDPVRLAESIATLDLASGGRFGIVAGLGYRGPEFAMAGVGRVDRGRLADEYLDVLLQAFTGEELTWRDRTIRVTPVPASPAAALVAVGGGTRRSAERAARRGLPFAPMVDDPELGRHYLEVCAALGHAGSFRPPSPLPAVHVAEDPDRAWAELGRYALYDAQTFATWQGSHFRAPGALDGITVATLRASGAWQVVTPDECVELLRDHGAVKLHPLMGGMPPELGWASLEHFVDRVLPRVVVSGRSGSAVPREGT